MLEIALSSEGDWPATDWEALAARAAGTAVALTPHGDLVDGPATVEVSVRLTSDDEVHELNRQYRQKDRPTNVLSFPMIESDLLDAAAANSGDGEVLLGDIVLAHGVCAREAAEKGVSLADHVAHLIVHGTLHLLGYDHMTGHEANAMEAIEIAALGQLGIADPYLTDED